MTDGMRTTTVTPQLVRDMTRDVTALVLSTRQSVVPWAIVGLGAVVVGLLAASIGEVGVLVALVVAVALVPVAVVAGTRRSVRRALAVTLAPGSTVGVRVGEDELHQSSALGSSQTAWSAFRDLRVRGSAAVLRMRASAVVVVLPSALLTDEDRAAIRDRIA